MYAHGRVNVAVRHWRVVDGCCSGDGVPPSTPSGLEHAIIAPE